MSNNAKNKPGYKTTEFWMSMFAMFMTGGMGMNPETVTEAVTYIPAAIAGIYTIGRSLFKGFTN